MSLLIEALKQAEARKGQKPGKPEDKPDATPGQAAPARADDTAEAPAPNSGLSLAPREEAPSIASEQSVSPMTIEAQPPAESPAGAQSSPPPTPAAAPQAAVETASPAAEPSRRAEPPAPAARAAEPVAAPHPAAAARSETPAARPPSGRLSTGSDAAQRTARDVLAAARVQGRPASSRWRVLLGALLALGALLLGGAWWLTRPGSGIATPFPPPAAVSDEVLAAAEAPAEANEGLDDGTSPATAEVGAAAPSAPQVDAAAAALPSAAAEPALPASPGEVGAAAPAPPAASASTMPASAGVGTPASSAAPAVLSAPSSGVGPTATLRIERARAAHQPLQEAWMALNRGELDAARRDYQRALQLHPGHPDALLGLAVIAERRGDPAGAARHYREVLKADPRNPIALAALVAGPGDGADGRSESQLREALAAAPRAPSLHLALGNLLAGAGRWAEAQQAYFEAAVLAPDDPDIAFNLGVALDRLHKPQLALEYYLRAEQLRRARPASYDPRELARRITTLSQQADGRGDRSR